MKIFTLENSYLCPWGSRGFDTLLLRPGCDNPFYSSEVSRIILYGKWSSIVQRHGLGEGLAHGVDHIIKKGIFTEGKNF